jgi:hypothetical protein
MTDSRAEALELAEKWTSMWNGDLGLVDEILAPDFAIEFGAVITDPDPTAISAPADMARFVAGWRRRFGDLRFELQGPPVVDDCERPAVAFTWSVAIPEVGSRSGIDLCHIVDARIARVWSVTGERVFPDPGRS